MQHHILGVGSVGTLIGFHLRKSIRRLAQRGPTKALTGLPAPHAHPFLPPPTQSGVTLHLRPSPKSVALSAKAKAKGKALDAEVELAVEADGAKQVETDFKVEQTDASTELARGVLATSSSSSRRRSPPRLVGLGEDDGESAEPSNSEAIDSLIISTKADSVLSALRSISRRITPDTTIVLATNGALGVLQELTERIFRDPARRPFFLLASNTHGTWAKAPRHTIHAAVGELQLALVPDPAKLEAGAMSTWERALAGAQSRSAAAGAVVSSLATASRPAGPLDLEALPAGASIRGTLASLLVLPLGVSWVPWADMRLLQRRKLVVNSCINPLTALLDVRNGALFGRKEVDGLIRGVCREAEAVFAAELLLEAEGGGPEAESTAGTLPPALRATALYAEVQRVIQATSPNWSSMHQDMHRRNTTRVTGPRRTEIDFINGSLTSLGRRLGVPTPTNDSLVDLIRAKAALVDTGAKAWGIA